MRKIKVIAFLEFFIIAICLCTAFYFNNLLNEKNERLRHLINVSNNSEKEKSDLEKQINDLNIEIDLLEENTDLKEVSL